MFDLHLLPKVRDSWSYLYLEHCRVDQDDRAIAFHDARGWVPIPCASLMLLMLGPGTTITHAAVRTLAECGCLVVWTGEEGVRLYAQGLGETRSSVRLQLQVHAWADSERRLATVRRMYELRFNERLAPDLTLPQIRGMEGVRVRDAYAAASRATGVSWSGRSYKRSDWRAADPINRALSAANACLYGVCHAAVLAAGYSPALGFIHTGKMLSFVYDVADLYKTETSLPVAFATVAEGSHELESRVRRALRDQFRHVRLLDRLVDDLAVLFGGVEDEPSADDEPVKPGALWSPDGNVEGGTNWAEPEPPE